mgnify:CR=1 FL=1
MVESNRVEDLDRAEQFGLNKPFTEVEFNIQLVATDKPELQSRHERKRALEGEAA